MNQIKPNYITKGAKDAKRKRVKKWEIEQTNKQKQMNKKHTHILHDIFCKISIFYE